MYKINNAKIYLLFYSARGNNIRDINAKSCTRCKQNYETIIII